MNAIHCSSPFFKVRLWPALAAVTLLLSAGGMRESMGQPPEAKASLVPAPAQGSDATRVVVARVNRSPIELTEVLRVTAPREASLIIRPGGTRWEDVKIIRSRELERRIAGRLYALAAAADPSVQATTQEVEQQYQQELQRLGKEASLEKVYGLESDEVRNLLAVSVAANRLREKHVIDQIEITPALKEEYYELHRKDQFTIPAQVSVQAIFRFADSEVEWASEERKIQAVRAELEEALTGVEKQRERVTLLSGFVRAYSEHEPTRTSGGLWYIYGGHNIQKEFWKFEDAAFEATVGELSPVVQVDRGYCIFLVGSKRPSRQQTYAEVERQIERILWKEQFEVFQEQWMQSLREKYRVEIDEDALMSGVEKDTTPATAGFPESGSDARR